MTERSEGSEHGAANPAGLRLVRLLFTVFAATAIGLLGTGGTYAFLNASASSGSTTTVTAGTAALSVVTPPQPLTGFYPGLTKRSSFEVRNDGDVQLDLRFASIAYGNSSAQLSATVAPGNCNGTPAGVPSGPIGLALDKGASAWLCLVITLPLEANNGAINQSSTVDVTIQGVQS